MADKKKKVKKEYQYKLKKKGNYKCRICGTNRSLIASYGLQLCRRCFRETGEKLGFRKY